ncbi:PREDICTED: uncharacterized protein LOC108561139 [Nicrophorus vespilloides]|uniref:Uncharacterized protein LOC108561139 n=1 Tax=Nicrophorus vespilloides TaxID=110193 RepID=A0ABM1MIN9_NICVS|nr:PREDICTED: uncharacterized protein LOC108561139 [Nicrophorus vespilloides]
MIKLLLVASLLFVSAATAQDEPEECVRASTSSPLDNDKTPQFIVMSFDDSATNLVYEEFYKNIFNGRSNPDGNPIKATFLIPHEYTDYEVVNRLYNEGHEIGVHSITKKAEAAYWQSSSVENLVDEFKGQKEIISKFANIPEDHIRVVRTPHLQLAGDKSFEAYKRSGLDIDSSWPALSKTKLFPYNLKCKSNAQCSIGECPEESYDEMWVVPINNIKGVNDIECNTLFACQMNLTQPELSQWLLREFKSAAANKSPFSLLVNSAWFTIYPDALAALQAFIDEVLDEGNTYFVSHSELVEWAKNPVEAANFETVAEPRSAECEINNICPLDFEEFGTRYMKSCVKCPPKYPWLGNPQGLME